MHLHLQMTRTKDSRGKNKQWLRQSKNVQGSKERYLLGQDKIKKFSG